MDAPRPKIVTQALMRARATALNVQPQSPMGGREYREIKDLQNKWARVQGLEPDCLDEANVLQFQADLEATKDMTRLKPGPCEALEPFQSITPENARKMFEDRYVSTYQNGLQSRLTDPAWLLWQRVLFAAEARAYEGGHAPFADDGRELAEVVGQSTEVKNWRGSLRKAIETGIDKSELAPESTVTCLIRSARVHRTDSGRRGRPKCSHYRAAGRTDFSDDAVLVDDTDEALMWAA